MFLTKADDDDDDDDDDNEWETVSFKQTWTIFGGFSSIRTCILAFHLIVKIGDIAPLSV